MAVRPGSNRDPWRNAPSEELNEQLLPRWFVLLAVILTPIAAITVVIALVIYSGEEVTPAERRPPPTDELAHDVGVFRTSEGTDTDIEVVDAACEPLDGIRVAGTAVERADLRRAVAATCNALPGGSGDEALAGLTAAGGIIRYAEFQITGVDSTLRLDTEVPEILVNARYSVSDEVLVAPLIAHDAVVFAGGPGNAGVALDARIAEAEVCRQVLGTRDASAGCAAAAELAEDPNALEALRDAGYE